MKKNIVILGSTGSIGVETLNIISKDKNNFNIKLLSTNKNIKKIYHQAKYFNVKNVIISDHESFLKAKKIYKKTNINFYNSFSIIDNIFSSKELFYSMISIVGLDGLDPTLRIIKYTKHIAIINKESLICGWNLIFKKLKKFKTSFFPIDSEHFSIFSLIGGFESTKIDKVYLTASGGPFLNFNKNDLLNANINQALEHPNWKMGKKITIDSATLMNKLFEVIEAKKIFNLSYSKIKILIHSESYVHALVKFNDGLTKILIHEPSMKIPIHNSIYYNDIMKLKSNHLNFKILNNLNFQRVNLKKFPLIKILKILPEKDSLFETVLVTINDYFVSAFLDEKIKYVDLIKYINLFMRKKCFMKFKKIHPKSINDIYKTRDYVNEKLLNSGI